MTTVKISPRFQVVIPQDVREALDVQPGQEVDVLHYEGRIELILRRPMRQMRGALRGIDTRVPRPTNSQHSS